MQLIVLIGMLTAASGCGENPLQPNTDVGLRVWAAVSPSSISIRDTTATLRIRVYVANPTSHEITVSTGGPPYVSTTNPQIAKACGEVSG